MGVRELEGGGQWGWDRKCNVGVRVRFGDGVEVCHIKRCLLIGQEGFRWQSGPGRRCGGRGGSGGGGCARERGEGKRGGGGGLVGE